jgi:hypothetical protein
MTKVTFEAINGDKTWRTIRVTVYTSRNGNMTAEYNGERYVWKDMRHGEKVSKLDKATKKWVQVGRVTHGTVFLGKEGELSYEEYQRTPEALEASRQFLLSFYKSKADEGSEPHKRLLEQMQAEAQA